MTFWKTGVVLLALLLAGMAVVPVVSAEVQANNRDLGTTSIEHHKISDDYLKDSKPAEWLPESEMITFVISQKTVGKLDQNKNEELINIPIEYLNSKSAFSNYNGIPSFYLENDLAKNEKIVLIRMPQQMYEQLIKSSHNGKLSLPENYFFRYYENISDLYSHIERDGNTLKIHPSDKYPIDDDSTLLNVVKTTTAASSQTAGTAGRSVSGSYSLLDETLPYMYAAREHAVRTHTDQNYDYCIGQTKPFSWTLLGSGSDQFTIFQEREYKFNSNEEIEIVVKHSDRNGAGNLDLFPATWRSGAQTQLSPSDYIQFPGYIPIDKNDLPHSYGYHVMFASGRYTIAFEDMETLDWLSPYIVSSAAGTTSFTELKGSSEYDRRSTPTTNSFEATTVVRDEWARIIGDSYFQYASNTWTQITPMTDQFVSVSLNTDNGRYTTTSHAAYP